MLRSSYYPKLDLLKQKRRGTYVTYDFFRWLYLPMLKLEAPSFAST